MVDTPALAATSAMVVAIWRLSVALVIFIVSDGFVC
jgi:hypothetical protein